MPDHFRDAYEEFFLRVFADADGDREIPDSQFFHDIQNEIRHLVCNVPPPPVGSGEDDILIMLRVARAVALARDPFASLDKKVRQYFARLCEGQPPFGEIAFQIAA